MDSSENSQEGFRLPLGQSAAKAKKRGRRQLEGDNEEETVARQLQVERINTNNGSSNNFQDSREEPVRSLQEQESQQQPPIVQGEAQVNLANEPVLRQLEQQTAQDEVEGTTTANDFSMPPPPGMNNPLLASASAGLPLARRTAAGFPGLDAQGNLFNPHMFMFPSQPQLPFGELAPGSQAQVIAASLLPTGQNGHLPDGFFMQPASGLGNNLQTGNQQEGQDAATLGNNNMALPFAGFQVAALHQLMLQQQAGRVNMNAAGNMMAMPGMPMAMMGRMPNMSLLVGTKSAAMSLGLSNDDEHLSEYQILVRKQLEVFEAQQDDVKSNTQGRKKSVTLGQVGLRCKHCASLPLRHRGKGAVYYPTKLQGIYQAAQNMANSHLAESCQFIDDNLKAAIKALRQRRDTASGGKMYWANGARALGIYEAADGLRIGHGG